MKTSLCLLLALSLITIACSSGSSSASTTTATVALTLDTLSGTVPVPVNGTLQSSSVFFTVAPVGGSVTVTLTSAVEVNPDGTTNPNVVMGVAVGTSSGNTCSLGTGNIPVLMQASANSTLSGNASGGAYCVQVSDVTNQVGPVNYTVAISHP